MNISNSFETKYTFSKNYNIAEINKNFCNIQRDAITSLSPTFKANITNKTTKAVTKNTKGKIQSGNEPDSISSLFAYTFADSEVKTDTAAPFMEESILILTGSLKIVFIEVPLTFERIACSKEF